MLEGIISTTTSVLPSDCATVIQLILKQKATHRILMQAHSHKHDGPVKFKYCTKLSKLGGGAGGGAATVLSRIIRGT